jgi:aspartate/methionine/tyrosine aminotransferase
MVRQKFAERIAKIAFSSSLASIRRIRELRAEGVRIHDFGTKADTPAHIKKAAVAYLKSAQASFYADSRGIPELRAAIVHKLARENDITVDPETDVTVTVGGKQAILSALFALVDRGDEVLLEDPGWLSFEPMVRLSGATPVPVPIHEKDGFKLTEAALTKRITPKSRILILCNPHNPTGRVLDRADLEMVARVARKHDLIVLMDEAYERFMYDGRRHVSLASLPGMYARTITVQTASKIYNMFGWRVGWIVAPAALSEKIQMISSHTITCVTSFAQAGTAAALMRDRVQGDIPLAKMLDNYQRQRDALVDGLNDLPGVSCHRAEGAYFAFPSFKGYRMKSAALRAAMFEQARVSGIAGSVFGRNGEGHMRFVFNASVPEIEAGLAQMRRFLRKLR